MRAQFGLERERSDALIVKEFKNDSGPFHFHSQIELYFVDAGEMEVVVNNHRRLLKQNELAVSLSFDAHSYRTVGTSRSSLLVIPPRLSQEFMAATGRKRARTPFICDPDAVERIRACLDAIRENPKNDMLVKGYLYVILGTVTEHISLEEADTPIDNDLSSRLLFFLNSNYRQDISLSTLSSKFGYSPSHLSRYFKSCFGVGVGQYVNLLRLRAALLLMQENRHSHTYCALESGFSSLRTFYRTFQREFGCAPGAYLSQLT